jgi:ABC-type sulfate transport system substrate-binding protein
MKKLALVGTAALFLATGAAQAPANAYELRCQTYYSGNQSYSRCVPWYTEQELYQQNQAGRINDLNKSSRGGTRRASEAACQAALEAGVSADVTTSYGCRE